MKKPSFVVMSLMTISLLASCGGDKPGPTPTEDVTFSATTSVTLDKSKTKADITLDWTPTEHSVECSDFTFTLTKQPSITSTIESEEPCSRPLSLTITFAKALSLDDIGNLKFRYNDKTAKKEGEGKVEGINVKLPVDPPGPTTYTLTVNCTGCTPSGNKSEYEEGANVSFTITPDPDYVLPTSKDEIEFDGIDRSAVVYDSTTGSLTFSMPASKVTVVITATSKPIYTFTFKGTNCSINGKNNYTEKVEKNESRKYTIKVDNYELLPISTPDIPEGVVYTCNEDFSSATLTIDKMLDNYTVKVAATTVSITITFKESLHGEVVDTSSCPRGTKWLDVNKPEPPQSDFVFNGWSFDSSFSGDIILDSFVFLNDMVVYPSYSYNCSLKDEDGKCSLQIDRLSGKYGQDLEITLSVKPNKIAKYDLPPLAKKEYSYNVSTSKGTKIDDSLLVYKVSPQSATLTIKNENNILEECGQIYIEVVNYQPGYTVEVLNNPSVSHLAFDNHYPVSNFYAAKKGEEYKFDVNVTDDTSNETEYYVPRRFSIYLGNSHIPIDESFYEVERSDDRKKAVVTIKENVINDDVTIRGMATQGECYSYEVISLGGIKSTDLEYASLNEAHPIQLEKDTTEGEYGYPKSENIYVKDAKADKIYSIDNDPNKFGYDEAKGELIIRNGTEGDSFTFLLAADEYPILEKASWDDIETISDNNYAPYFFSVGEEKIISVGGVDHKIRIIGFNHDDLADGSGRRAGITFEFAELFTIKDGSRYLRYTIDWGIDNYYFPNQHINGFCNGDVYDRLPDGLQKVIKNVFKDTTVKQSNEFVLEDYPTKLFPLSYEEMTEAPNKMMGNEGFIYQYYKENDLDECRKKHASHQENYAGYWLRSFPPGSGVLAGACEDDGSPNHLVPIIFGGIERSVAPAFCV